ncbi:MAG: methyltransferase domain-containing protein [Bryobacteraceae bacterium]
MPIEDWDARYRAGKLDPQPAPLLIEAVDLLPPGRALDVACGPGRHALHLARAGWRVTAVDGSRVAIAALQQRAARERLAIQAVVADLERGEFVIEPERYDLVCDFFYLQRDLFPAMLAGLRPGGVFAGVIHMHTPGFTPRHPEFLVSSGELREFFRGWKILYYSERPPEGGHRRATAQILARRA